MADKKKDVPNIYIGFNKDKVETPSGPVWVDRHPTESSKPQYPALEQPSMSTSAATAAAILILLKRRQNGQ